MVLAPGVRSICGVVCTDDVGVSSMVARWYRETGELGTADLTSLAPSIVAIDEESPSIW